MVDQTDSATVAPGSGDVDVNTFDVPAGLTLVIVGLGTGCRDGMGSMLGTWSLKNGSQVIEGYHHLPFVVGSIDQPSRVQAILRGPATFKVAVRNEASISVYTYAARIMGWLYQADEREAQ